MRLSEINKRIERVIFALYELQREIEKIHDLIEEEMRGDGDE